MAIAKTHLELAALMAHQASEIFDAGGDAGMYANMAKYAGAEAEIEAVDVSIQVHGGSGFTTDVDVITDRQQMSSMRVRAATRCAIFISSTAIGLFAKVSRAHTS